MLKLFGRMNAESGDLSIISNPFLKDKVHRITIEIRPKTDFIHKNTVEATVWFKNGSTSGNQGFHGDNLADVVQQIETVLNDLK